MADTLSGLSPQEIVDKLTTVGLSAHDQLTMLGLIDGLVAASTLPASELGSNPTWREVVDWLKSPFVDFGKKTVVARAAAAAAAGGLLDSFTVTPDSHPPNEDPSMATIKDWLRRAVKGFFEEVYDSETNAAKGLGHTIGNTEEAKAVVVNAVFDAIEAVLGKISDYVTSGTPLAGKLAAHVINQISGTNIDVAKIEADLSGVMTRAGMVDIGAQFGEIIKKMFPVEPTAAGEVDRSNRAFAVDNVNAYFGTNLNFQMRSLAIGTLASIFPIKQLQQFENLHQSINWAYGFGWMSWTVLAAIMNATTTKPLTEYYNQRIKGNDLSESEALHAFVQKRIDGTTLSKILDNQGMRDDIRQIRIDQSATELTASQAAKAFTEGLIDDAEFTRVMNHHGVTDKARLALLRLEMPQLTEGDINEGYENGLFSEADVSDHYKRKGFSDFNLTAKIDLAKDQRLFQLRKRLEETMFHGYVIGTVAQQEFTNYLGSINYNALEVEMELKRAEIIARSHQQKHLTRAEILRLVGDGSMQASDGLARLTAQGLPDADARRLLADSVLRHAVSLVPSKIRDACTGPDVEKNLLSAAITTATEIDPQYIVENKDFFQQAKCILEHYLAPGSGGGGTPGPTGPPPPTNLIATKQGADVILTWIAPVAGLEYTPYRRSTADATAIQLTGSSLATSYVDRNVPVGHTYVYTVRSKFAGQESVDSNQVVVDVQ